MRCAGCQQTEPTLFYSGVTKWCKECWKSRVRMNRAAKIEYYREYDRNRNDQPDRVAARKAYAASHPEKNNVRTKQFIERHPDKRAAHIIVGNAIRGGKLKAQPCERCGYGVGVQAHHEDYSKPLDVMWLCKRCHGQRHREINEERRKSA